MFYQPIQKFWVLTKWSLCESLHALYGRVKIAFSEEILMKNFIFGTVSVRPITHMISEITTLS